MGPPPVVDVFPPLTPEDLPTAPEVGVFTPFNNNNNNANNNNSDDGVEGAIFLQNQKPKPQVQKPVEKPAAAEKPWWEW